METENMDKVDTYFANPARTDGDTLNREVEEVTQSPIMGTLLKSVGGLLAILDENRQIISLNDSLAEVLKIANIHDVLGLRPGEALGCRNAEKGPGGCGTSKFCSSCGAAISIVTCLSTNESAERNCYIETGVGELKNSLAFQVRAHRVTLNEKTYVLLFLQDISRQEQRASLERTFFHDINNLLQGLNSASDMLRQELEDNKLVEIISFASRMLVKEVEIQRCLLKDDLLDCRIYRQDIKLSRLLEEIESLFSHNPLAEERHLLISSDNPDLILHTDMALLIRIINNMILNGLEASEENQAVSLWTEKGDGTLCFFVHNMQFMQEETAGKIFQKNFSTKSEAGRGLGTYSMKLLGEKILGGQVCFSTSEERGTVFSFCLPL